jgi:hypothetical protein
MKKHIGILAFVFSAVLLSFLLSSCAGSDPSTVKTYDFGRDKVPDITSVVGDRSFTVVENEGSPGFPSKQYTYQSNTVFDDLSQYTQLLQEKDWAVAGGGYNLEESPGDAQFVMESADKGQILVILITYKENEYIIKISKIEAVLTNLGSDGD